jgi:Icc-related predicted phosphoesterase
LGPGRVELSATLAREGGTRIELPPLGRLSADTHAMPVRLGARVVEVDIGAAQRAARGPEPFDTLQRQIIDDLPDALRALVLRTVLWSALAGAIAVMLLPGRRPSHALPGAVGGALAVSVVLAGAWLPYDLDAFREPTFEGELTRVPGLIVAAERNLDDLDAVRSRIDVVSDRLAGLYAASVGELPGGAAGETAILHVSDLHLNPLGAELVVQLAGDLDVDAILDTGDVTSFGLPPEARFADILARAPVPYLLVPGNHDAPTTRAEMAAVPGITVLDGRAVDVGGLRILGIGDPTFTATNAVSTDEANQTKVDRAEAVAELVRAEEPDVLAVHHALQAQASSGEVPLVVAGHVHERSEVVRDGTRILTVGSAGATGLGTFSVETGQPYEAEVLRFQDDRLVAIDYLTMAGVQGDFSLERRLVDEPDDPHADDRDDSAQDRNRPTTTTTSSPSVPDPTPPGPDGPLVGATSLIAPLGRRPRRR